MPLPALTPLPFLGRSGGLARFFRDPVSTLARLRALGDVAAIHAGKEPLIAAFGAEHNRQLLSDAQRFHNFASVPFPVPPGSSAERVFQALRVVLPRFHPALAPGARIDLRNQGITMGPKPGILMILRAREEGPGPAVAVGGRIRELVDLPA